MKTRFSRTGSRPLLSGGRLFLGALTLGVAILLLVRAFFPDALFALSRPLIGTGTALTAAVGSAVGVAENEEDVRAARDRALIELESLRAENATLQAQLSDLGRLGDTSGRITAGVIARPPTSPYDTLVVDRGARDGVIQGAYAFGQGGIPIGTVAVVGQENAHIALYSAPGRETPAWAGETRIPVTLLGAGAGAFRASVAKDAGLLVGDLVYVPGDGALAIGSIARIDTDPSSPEATVFVRPLANPFSLSMISLGRTAP